MEHLIAFLSLFALYFLRKENKPNWVKYSKVICIANVLLHNTAYMFLFGIYLFNVLYISQRENSKGVIVSEENYAKFKEVKVWGIVVHKYDENDQDAQEFTEADRSLIKFLMVFILGMISFVLVFALVLHFFKN